MLTEQTYVQEFHIEANTKKEALSKWSVLEDPESVNDDYWFGDTIETRVEEIEDSEQ